MIIAKLLRNTLSNFGMKILMILMSLIASPVLIETIGPERYGLLLFVATVNGFFDILGGGVPSGTVKFVAQHDALGDHETVHKILDSSLAFFLGVGAVVCVGLLGFTWLGGLASFQVRPEDLPTVQTLLTVSACFALLSWPATVLSNTLEGLQEHHTKNVILGVTGLLSMLAATLTALATRDLLYVFLAQQAALVLRWLWLLRASRRHLPDWTPRPHMFDRDVFRLIFGLSVWMLLIQLASLLNYKVDELILGAALPFAMVAVYDTLVRPFRLVQQASGLFNSAIMPAVSAREARGGRDALEVFTHTGVRYNNLFVAPLALTATFFCGPFLALWQQRLFAETQIASYLWVAQLACAFQLVWQSNSTLNRVFYGTGQVERIAVIAFITAGTNAILSVILVGPLGVAGVILATVLVGVFAVPAQYIFLFPLLELRRGHHLAHNVLRAQLPSALIAACLIPLWGPIQRIDSWAVLAPCALGVFLTMIAASWRFGVEPDHKAWVYERLRRARS